MLTSSLIDRRVSSVNVSSDHRELNRLLAAAVINRNFCSMLLADPIKAIHDGYCGEVFSLTDQEFSMITSIQATSLTDLAKKISEQLRFQRKENDF